MALNELEAFEPDQLIEIMRNAIRSVLDYDLFVEEQQKEKDDARYLNVCRRQMRDVLKEIIPDAENGGAA